MPVNNASGGFEIDPVSPSTLMSNNPTFHLHQPPFHCWGTNLILLHVGQPCNANGDFLSQETCPEPHQPKAPDDWSPYGSCLEFELADFLYTHNQMSAAHINILLDLWAASLLEAGRHPLFSDYKRMYNTIDSTQLRDIKWQFLTVKYTGDPGADTALDA